jgi:hypothetical protein
MASISLRELRKYDLLPVLSIIKSEEKTSVLYSAVEKGFIMIKPSPFSTKNDNMIGVNIFYQRKKT